MAKVDVVVRGLLGADVETKWSKAGKPFSVLRVGSTPSKRNADGGWDNGETMWFGVTVFEELNPFEFKKGTPVVVEGVFTHEVFVKRDGSQGFALKVVASKVERVESKKSPVVFDEKPVEGGSWVQPVVDLDDAPF